MRKILIVGANGYIGSKLYSTLKKDGLDVYGIDNGLRNVVFKNDDIENISYQDFNQKSLEIYTDCIWLSGYSSVVDSESAGEKAFFNNFVDLVEFYKRFTGRFIYASSGSVYSRTTPEYCSEGSPTSQPLNIYDYTKLAFDNYIISTNSKAIGLRFGTVNGPGVNIKEELMLNSMVKTGLKDNQINLMNGKFYRPILSIDDLISGITNILNSDVQNGIFNMCSFNSTIEELAKKTSQILNVEVNDRGNSKTYNFMMDNSKFEEVFNFSFQETPESLINSLIEHYNS